MPVEGLIVGAIGRSSSCVRAWTVQGWNIYGKQHRFRDARMRADRNRILMRRPYSHDISMHSACLTCQTTPTTFLVLMTWMDGWMEG